MTVIPEIIEGKMTENCSSKSKGVGMGGEIEGVMSRGCNWRTFSICIFQGYMILLSLFLMISFAALPQVGQNFLFQIS